MLVAKDLRSGEHAGAEREAALNPKMIELIIAQSPDAKLLKKAAHHRDDRLLFQPADARQAYAFSGSFQQAGSEGMASVLGYISRYIVYGLLLQNSSLIAGVLLPLNNFFSPCCVGLLNDIWSLVLRMGSSSSYVQKDTTFLSRSVS